MIGSPSEPQFHEEPYGKRPLNIRSGTFADAALIHTLILELAASSKQVDEVKNSSDNFSQRVRDEDVRFRTLVAEWEEMPAGFAIFFDYYSSWSGLGLYLEYLYVRPEFRRRGIAKALLARVCSVAVSEQRKFLRWSVLDWNLPAINLYRSVGACPLEPWKLFCLPRCAMQEMARDGLR